MLSMEQDNIKFLKIIQSVEIRVDRKLLRNIFGILRIFFANISGQFD